MAGETDTLSMVRRSLISVAFFAALLAGCSPTVGEPGTVGDSGEIYAAFTTVEEPYSGDMLGGTFPYVFDVTPTSFVLVNGGSSSCPNIVERVSVTEGNAVNVEYRSYRDAPCTDDFRVTLTEVQLVDLVLNDADSAVFTVGGLPAVKR